MNKAIRHEAKMKVTGCKGYAKRQYARAIRRAVRCTSGLMGERCRLQMNYRSFEEFEAYDNIYALAARLGFESAEQAWVENPVIEYSVEPSDYKKVAA